jgi:hypothetical protein
MIVKIILFIILIIICCFVFWKKIETFWTVPSRKSICDDTVGLHGRNCGRCAQCGQKISPTQTHEALQQNQEETLLFRHSSPPQEHVRKLL